MIIAARVELRNPLCAYSPSERERIADVLSSIATDIKKAATGDKTIRFAVEIEQDYGD